MKRRRPGPLGLPLLAALLCGQGCSCPASEPGGALKAGPAAAARAEVATLPRLSGLPDALTLADGSRVTEKTWGRRRQEMTDLLLRYQYGHPPAAGRVRASRVQRQPVFGGAAHKELLLLTLEPGKVRFYVGLYVPTGRGPFPTILHIDHRKIFGISAAEQLVKRGFLLAGYDPTQLDPDQPGAVGPAQAVHPDQDWATLMVWAWGASRVLDHLLILPRVDRTRVAVTGHSRSGKTALLTGAMDLRFSVTAPQGSGAGGAALHREPAAGAETLAQVTRGFPHWFHPRLRALADQEDRLPFDQHFLYALVAPRALITLDARQDLWASPAGTWRAHKAARPVFELLGASGKLRYHLRPGKHEITDADWSALADFCDGVWR